MKTIEDVEQAGTAALKAGDKPRLDYVRNLVNQIRLIAKNDGNRESTPDDIIAAANRIVKQNRETISFLEEDDERRAPLIAEIATVQEFLPQQMAREELTTVIEGLIAEGLASGNPKTVRGHVMKSLNGNYRGRFDAQMANQIMLSRI